MSQSPSRWGLMERADLKGWNDFWHYTLGICIIISFISFGYMTYQWFGYLFVFFLSLFIGLMLIGLNVYTRDIKEKVEKNIHDQYNKETEVKRDKSRFFTSPPR